VQLVAVEAIAGAEAFDLLLNAPLLGLEPRELALAIGE
jgi:hypothetical protein